MVFPFIIHPHNSFFFTCCIYHLEPTQFFPSLPFPVWYPPLPVPLLPTFPISTAPHPLHNRLLPHLCLYHLPPACLPPPQHPSAPTHSQTPTSLPSSVTDSSSTVQTSPAMVGGEFHRALVLLLSRSSQSSPLQHQAQILLSLLAITDVLTTHRPWNVNCLGVLDRAAEMEVREKREEWEWDDLC